MEGTEKERQPAGKELQENGEANEQKGIDWKNSNHYNRNALPVISLEVSSARRLKRNGEQGR
jgi:hypothetical protein